MSPRTPRKVVIRGEEAPAATKPADVETYTVHAKCGNCDWEGDADIPKGFPVKKGECLNDLSLCPTCGCTTLIRCDKTVEAAPSLLPPAIGPDTMREYDRVLREAQEERRWAPPPPHQPWFGDSPNYYRSGTVTYTSVPSTSHNQHIMHLVATGAISTKTAANMLGLTGSGG